MFSNYHKPEWFWQAVNIVLSALAFYFLVLPHSAHLPTVLGYSACWFTVSYLIFMIVHGTAGGVAVINSKVPRVLTVTVAAICIFMLGLGAYLNFTAT